MGLTANDLIELMVGDHRFRTRVLKCLGADVYLDALPEIESEWTPVPGSVVAVIWFEDDIRWVQMGRVIDVLDPLQILLLRMEGVARKNEQRAFPRVKVSAPLEYALPRQQSVLMTTTLDVSVVGIRFPSAFRVWNGLNLRLTLRLGHDVLNLTGVVIRFTPKELRGRLQWETVIRFVNPSPGQRRLLSRYVEQELVRHRGGHP